LESFLVIVIIPLTLTALAAAIGLLPPMRASALRKDRAETTAAEALPMSRLIVALTLVAFCVAYLAYIRYLIEPSPPGSIPFWQVAIPAFAMVIALFIWAWRLVRLRR
jgi:Na+/glutamate symporter